MESAGQHLRRLVPLQPGADGAREYRCQYRLSQGQRRRPGRQQRAQVTEKKIALNEKFRVHDEKEDRFTLE